MSGVSERRKLRFDRLEQVMPEVDRLLAGYRVRGNWSLGQVCNHLAKGLQGAVEGSSKQMPWLIRRLVGPIILRRIVKHEWMPTGVRAPEGLEPVAGLDDRAEAEALRATIKLFLEHTGPLAEHPLFGRLTREQWTRLHCVHCAHHLSFLEPVEAAEQ